MNSRGAGDVGPGSMKEVSGNLNAGAYSNSKIQQEQFNPRGDLAYNVSAGSSSHFRYASEARQVAIDDSGSGSLFARRRRGGARIANRINRPNQGPYAAGIGSTRCRRSSNLSNSR